MKKNKVAKKTLRKSRKATRYSSGFLPYLLAGFTVSIALFLYVNYQNSSGVLGSSTFLARGGDDNVAEVNSESGSSGSSEGGGSSGSSQEPPHGAPQQIQNGDHPALSIPESTRDLHIQEDRPPRSLQVNPTSGVGIVPPPRGIREDSREHEQPELEEGDDVHIENATGSSGFLVRHKGVEAEAEDKLEHDPSASNSLLLTTPSGKQHILILPDQALDTVLSHNMLTSVPGADASGGAKIKLVSKDNGAVFEVEGVKSKKFLGLIPVTIPKTVNVSATDGSVVNTTQSFFSKLLDLLSS